LKRYQRRLRYWLNHSNRQHLLREEMEFHVDSMAQDLAAQGMSEEEARFTARRRFGNMTRTSEDARFTWIAHWISESTPSSPIRSASERRRSEFEWPLEHFRQTSKAASCSER
jgi:hypothetical protein